MSLLFYSIAYTEPFYFKTTIDEGRGQAWEASKILNKGRRPLNKTLLTAHTRIPNCMEQLRLIVYTHTIMSL